MFDFPVITFALIAVTCVVSFQGFKSRDFEGRFVFMPEAILAWKQYYRLVTSAFLHANPQHLIFNMLSLYLFGRYLEAFPGRLAFLAIYFGAIIGGDLLSLYVHRHHQYSSYGASGGVAGVIFAAILLNPGIRIAAFFVPIFIPGWIYAILYLAYSFFGMKEHRGDVGHDAHLGGAIIGFLIAAAIQPAAVAANFWIFLTVLAGAILLLVYLWWNPLFLPLSSVIGRPTFRRQPKAASAPKSRRETAEVDAILEKIGRSGMDSLTEEEKAVLGQTANKYQRRSDSSKPRSGLAI
jgi:membrane associated rhomboid family serine protease